MAHRRAVVSLDVEKAQAYGLPGNTSQRRAVFLDDQAKGSQTEELSGCDGPSRTLDTFMQDKSLKEVASRVCVKREEDAIAISQRLNLIAACAELEMRKGEMHNFISPEQLSEKVDEAKKAALFREIQDAKNGKWPGVGLAIPLPLAPGLQAQSESANDAAGSSSQHAADCLTSVDLDFLNQVIQGYE